MVACTISLFVPTSYERTDVDMLSHIKLRDRLWFMAGWHRREQGWVNKILSITKKKVGWMKNKTTQGMGNKNLFSFPKHDSLKYWRLKSNVNSHMSIQYVL